MKKFVGLELCRFFCAVAIVLWHYQHFFVKGIWDNSITTADRVHFPLYPILRIFYDNGYLSVQIFWVISGFIFFWKYSDLIYERSVGPGSFFVWRFSRLYPLHFVTLIAVAVLQYLYISTHGTSFIYSHNDMVHFFMQLALASNWVGRQPFTFNGPTWSISAEVIAYACFFGVVYFVRPGILKCAFAVLATKILLFQIGDPVITCMQFFFAGGLVQQILTRLDEKYQRVAFFSSLSVVVAIVAAPAFSKISITATYFLLFSMSIVSVSSLLGHVIRIDFSKLTFLGDLTYSSYLLHFPLQVAAVLLVDTFGGKRTLFLHPLSLLSFLLATFGLAWMVHRHFEMRAQNAIRALWLSRRKQPVFPKPISHVDQLVIGEPPTASAMRARPRFVPSAKSASNSAGLSVARLICNWLVDDQRRRYPRDRGESQLAGAGSAPTRLQDERYNRPPSPTMSLKPPEAPSP